ncbi:LysR family transcriptional regulator [Neptunicoccus cionae]|uniref:Transcriptional regulator GcvA n=1 Tax=Neptunicoccus cionae TaxID=2035344 RepID=A0A916R075_9RHOB|nr:LysR family transcriptional regulator [Amylibacter cionae]GGA21918.1 transcriptional regulator GcvA [Amylibacter cionae]
MAKSLPPLTWFRAFEAAARHLSFTAAAEEIGMTQSAVSQQVKSLESRLGVALFVRQARGLMITDDGRKLMPQVTSALETLGAAARSFEIGTTQNLLTIATSVTVAQWFIAPRLATFRMRHPDVRFRFLSTIWPDDFNSISADVEIPFGSEKQFGQGAVLLEPNGLVAMKSPALDGPLERLPLIEAVGTSSGWKNWQEGRNLDLAPRIYVDSFGAALNMAVHGNGVALVSEALSQPALDSGTLVLADSHIAPSQEGYYLRADPRNTTAMVFRDWMLEESPH